MFFVSTFLTVSAIVIEMKKLLLFIYAISIFFSDDVLSKDKHLLCNEIEGGIDGSIYIVTDLYSDQFEVFIDFEKEDPELFLKNLPSDFEPNEFISSEITYHSDMLIKFDLFMNINKYLEKFISLKNKGYDVAKEVEGLKEVTESDLFKTMSDNGTITMSQYTIKKLSGEMTAKSLDGNIRFYKCNQVSKLQF